MPRPHQHPQHLIDRFLVRKIGTHELAGRHKYTEKNNTDNKVQDIHLWIGRNNRLKSVKCEDGISVQPHFYLLQHAARFPQRIIQQVKTTTPPPLLPPQDLR